MNITINEAAEADNEALRKIYLQVRQTSFIWLSSSSFRLSSFDVDTEGEYILVARVNDKIVGFISVWIQDNFIHHLYIDNEYQNKCIGTQLLNKVISMLKRPVTLKCMKNNTAAIRFYVRNGWEAKQEGMSEDGGYILFEYKR